MTLALSDGRLWSLESAQNHLRNLLVRFRRRADTEKQCQDLWRDREKIQTCAARHLGLANNSSCEVQDVNTWTKGQFNICVLICVSLEDGSRSQLILRCPMPHKVGEQHCSGATDEKMRAEIASYAWIEEHCPEIPIPRLHGFQLSNNLQFTHRRDSAGYVQDSHVSSLNRPYMLLEHIGSRGRILAEILDDVRGSDSSKKQNLLRGISKITLALARTSHARIGSLRFNDDTFSTLETRPLFCANSILESEGVPRVVNRTYETERAFIEDMLRFREEAFRTQPNAVYDEEDCRLQMYHMVVLRAVHTLLVDYKFQGPYVLQLTDFHAGNIFVDEEWNITGIIDLEFICALPPSMMNVPYWLSVKAIDNIRENMAVVAKVHETYMNIFREEERHCTHEHDLQLSLSIQGAWESGACWLYGCITSIDGTPYFVEEHICEELGIRLSLDEEKRFAILMSHLWSRDSENIVRQKLHDKAEYDKAIVQHFSQELDMV